MATNYRIAAIQHGDYLEALQVIGAGRPEPYAGMRNSLEVLAELFADQPHLVISLNAPAYREERGRGLLIGMPPRPPVFGFSSRMATWIRARAICAELAAFNPTHVLLRTGSYRAISVLQFCERRHLSSLVLFANTLGASGTYLNGHLIRHLVTLLNGPNVFLVGNHRQPATDELIEFGVDPSKVVAYDWPVARHPRDFSPKPLVAGDAPHIVYAGSIREDKGVIDLIAAAEQLHAAGFPLRVTCFGSGPILETMRLRAQASNPSLIQFPGRVPNDLVFDAMCRATFVCVPSHHDFAEGMPFTLTEALTSRTPVIVSDHPVIRRCFVEGEGLRFFPAGDAAALAKLIRSILADAPGYAALSISTAAAFGRIECKVMFGDIIRRWKDSFTSASDIVGLDGNAPALRTPSYHGVNRA